MIRVFLDANILFSAAWRSGGELAQLWERHTLRLVTSPDAALEAEQNLAQQRPHAVARLYRAANTKLNAADF